MRHRVYQLLELWRFEARAMHLMPLAGSCALSLLILFLMLRRPVKDPARLMEPLSLVAIVLGLGFAFIFDDPARDSIAHAPTSLLLRRTLRFAVSASVVAVVWAGVLLASWLRAQQSIPIGTPTLYLVAALVFVAAVACATGQATREGPGGIAGGPILLLLIGASRVLPARFRFFEAQSNGSYSVSLRLSVVAALSVLVVVWASLDPGRARWRLFGRRGHEIRRAGRSLVHDR
jgi:hypothetical protein